MVEIFSTDRTMSLGCFVNFKAAKGTLSGLADAGILSEKPAVMVCSYKNDEPQREYVATYSGGKWHTPRIPKVPHTVENRTKDATGNVCAKNTRLRNTASVKGFLTG